MGLIEQLGYEFAKQVERDSLEEFPDCADGLDVVVCAKGLNFTYLQVVSALLDHRRQHNIFEMDDYIVYEGELMVFAMWSEAAKDCAYVGYAYAENGCLAHKDEFRHATDEEIKAGKRLPL